MANSDRDTHIGGSQGDFPSTNWGRFLSSHTGAGPAEETSFELLAMGYWKPIYAYIRRRWAKSNEDAKDLTQDFFIWMIESDFVKRADPTRGRFRAFIKVALEHYLSNDQRNRNRIKRGGAQKTFLFGGDSGGEMSVELPDVGSRTPDEVLDETWKNELLTKAQEQLEQAYKAEGKQLYFQVFQDYFLCDSEEMDYKEVAARHGITAVDVSNFLMNAKKRFRSILTDLVAETVRGPEELSEELRVLFGEETP